MNLPETMPTSPGADDHAPFFPTLSPRDVLDMRLEIEAAGVGALDDYEQLQEQLTVTEEMLEDALAERGED